MSFSYDMKQEIARHKPLRGRWKEPFARGLFLFSRSYDAREISLYTEHGEVAALFEWLVHSLVGRGAQVDVRERSRSGKVIYQLHMPAREQRLALLALLGQELPGPEQMEPDEAAAFLAGAFLACGNVTDPQKAYHLEFVVHREEQAQGLAALLEDVLPGAKRTRRRGAQVIYFKECAQIEDLMTLMGAVKSCLAMIDVEMVKSVRNQANRATNCETANIDKLVSAAASQVEDIRLVLERTGENGLPDNLREIALLRLENPDLSLRELAEAAPTPISRSGVHHRLNKISQIAAELRGK